jgi:hypothetical protein
MLVEHDVFPNPFVSSMWMQSGVDDLKLSDLTPQPGHVLVHDVFPAGFCYY